MKLSDEIATAIVVRLRVHSNNSEAIDDADLEINLLLNRVDKLEDALRFAREKSLHLAELLEGHAGHIRDLVKEYGGQLE